MGEEGKRERMRQKWNRGGREEDRGEEGKEKDVGKRKRCEGKRKRT